MKRLLGFVILLAVWELSSCAVGSIFFPGFVKILPALWDLIVSGEIFSHAAVSLMRISLGFLLAAVVGICLGVLVTQSRTLDLVLSPVIDAVRPIAALTIFPLLILLLGLGNSSKVAVIFWTAWPAVLLNTAEGIRRVERSLIEAARLDGAGQWDVLRYITFVLGLPAIITGLRIGMSGGWISLVSAEMLGASRGLGFSILAYSQTFRFAKMYAIIIVIALLGLSMNLCLAQLQTEVDKRIGEDDANAQVYQSPFIRYLSRAAGFAVDSIRVSVSPRQKSG